MNAITTLGAGIAIVGAALSLAAPDARAQAVPAPQEAPRTIPGLVIASPTPVPATTPVPVPSGPVLGLPAPSSSATPAQPGATRRPPARPRGSAIPPTEPRPIASDTPAATPTAKPTPLVAASPTPAIAADVAPSTATGPATTAAAAPAPATPTPAPATGQGDSNWPWLAGGAAPVILALLVWVWWRRRSPRDTGLAIADHAPPAVAAPIPVAPIPVAPVAAAPVAPVRPTGPRARIAITLRPTRAGLNMLSATVEAEVVVTNTGDAPANQIRVYASLLSAHAGQDADLAAAFAAPDGRPAAPPFALAPGEERRVRVVAALSRDAVRSMDAGGRPMFVPLVAIDLRYASDAVGTPGRTGQAYAVGVERVDSAKLAPFWLDGALRMHDQIAARAQGDAVTD